ncbi:MAG: hypothetical protein LBP69_05660 [Treponema sp.]|jgi:hypothetical protein|nr:hypothetical protein [Treponema sp.]
MKMVRTLELARAGEWGQDGAPITRRDLAEIVETFAGRPPLTIGHIPQGRKEGPRYGQVLAVGLAESGNTLTGRVEFGDAAGAAYTAGEYDGWSVSIPRRGKDGKRYLHHLALLGETPPKIPGLRDLGDGLPMASYEYADGDRVEAYSFEGALKEVEEQVDPQKENEELKKKLAVLEADNKKLLEEKAEREKAAAKEAPEVKSPESVPPAAPAAESGGGEKPKDDFSDRLARAEKELQKSRVDAFMAKAGEKLPQGLRDKAKALAEQLAGSDEPFNFSDNGKAVSGKALNLLGELFLQWPAPVKTGSEGFNFADEGGKGADWGKVAAGM